MHSLAYETAKTTEFVCRYEASGRRPLGARGAVAPRRRPRRYWARSQRAPPTDDAADAEARAGAYRRALADDPHDEDLWLRYIEFQVRCRCGVAAAAAGRSRTRAPQERRAEAGGGAGGDAAADAAERGAAACPRSWRLRAALHAALRRALSPDAYLARLRGLLAAAEEPGERGPLALPPSRPRGEGSDAALSQSAGWSCGRAW